jgi:hypothetical protein
MEEPQPDQKTGDRRSTFELSVIVIILVGFLEHHNAERNHQGIANKLINGAIRSRVGNIYSLER